MKTIREQARDIPVLNEADVVVVGGGPGGIGAALASARNGAKTVLLEQSNGLGGIATRGLSNGFFCVDFNVAGGIFFEICKELKARGVVCSETYQHWQYDIEYYKRLLDELMVKAGVQVLYHARAIDVVTEGNTIKSVIFDTDDGKAAVTAKVVIDASKYSSIAKKAGAQLMHYENQPVVSVIFLRGVDFNRLVQEKNENPDWVDITKLWDLPERRGGLVWWPWNLIGGAEGIRKARERGEITYDGKIGVCMFSVAGPGRALAYIYEDGKGQTWTYENRNKNEFRMKEQQWQTFGFLKKNVPGFQNSEIEQVAFEASTFATKIEGDFILTAKDNFAGSVYNDSILTCTSQFDPPNGNRRMDVPLYDVPYRTLYSKNIDNLMSAGINVSADSDTTWMLWGNPICMGMGQSSGTAAAIVARRGITPREVDMKLLQKTLRDQGQNISKKDLPNAVNAEYDDYVTMKRELMNKEGKDKEVTFW